MSVRGLVGDILSVRIINIHKPHNRVLLNLAIRDLYSRYYDRSLSYTEFYPNAI